MRKLFAVCLALLLLSASTVQAISIPEEKKLGKEFLKTIQDKGLILHDPVAEDLLRTVGKHIVSTLPTQPFHFDFYLLNEDSFNAFASPSANIFVYTGLFSALDTVDELAGILGHEIGHAVGRHVSQSIDRSKFVTAGTLAGMLAGVLLGAAGAGGDAAQAITVGSMAAGQSSMLAFTRENETEADQKAVLFLDNTGYSPEGILAGLNKMRASDFYGLDSIPDYFKTHPGTSTRITHLAGILADHKNPPNKPAPPKTVDFQMVKYRLIGLYGDPERYLSVVEGRLSLAPDDPALNYGAGLLYGRLRQTEKGIVHLKKALAVRVFDPMILLALGRLNLEKGDYEKALTVLEGVKEDKVLGPSATYYASVARIETGDLSGAQTGLETVLEEAPATFPRANYHMAHIMARLSDDPMSHYYLGVFHARTRDFKNAERHLRLAVDTLTDPKFRKLAQKELDQLAEKKEKEARPGA